MMTYVQVGNYWLNTAQIRAVRIEPGDNDDLVCRIEFDREHVLTFKGDDAKAIRGYLAYHMTTPPGPTGMPQ
jgi:hypothetical protein